MAAFELRIMPLSELKPAPYNPRRVLSPTSPAYKKLRASLAEFGLVEPLIWNELTGHVVGGHARLRILAELGYSEVPVSVVRLSDARERALNVVTLRTLCLSQRKCREKRVFRVRPVGVRAVSSPVRR